MLISLYLSLREIHLSVVSLDIVLSDLEKENYEEASEAIKKNIDNIRYIANPSNFIKNAYRLMTL